MYVSTATACECAGSEDCASTKSHTNRASPNEAGKASLVAKIEIIEIASRPNTSKTEIAMPFKKGQSGNPGGQWRPGQSGNPNGRPKSRPFKDALDRVLKAMGDGDASKGLDKLAASMAAKAETGDVAAFKEIADRYEGKVPTPIGGTDELPAIRGFSWIEPEDETIPTQEQSSDSKEIH